MVSRQFPPQRLFTPTPRLFQLLFALLFCAGTAPAATVYNLTFEEPVHHLGSTPATGGAPDKVTSLIGNKRDPGPNGSFYEPPTVVTEPAMPGQSLKLVTGSTNGDAEVVLLPPLHVTRGITLAAPAALSPDCTVSFDLVTNLMSAGTFEVQLTGGYVLSWGPNSQLSVRDSASSKDITVAVPAQPNSHLDIAVTPSTSEWAATCNGVEIFREPYSATAAPELSFVCSEAWSSAEEGMHVLLDNIVVADFVANQAPSFTKGANVTVTEDSAAYSQVWATNISAGAGESGQHVSFEVTADHPGFFSVAPAISSTGVLTFTPVPNAFGQTTVTVLLHDDGGTFGGGVDVSAPQTFTIELTALNDPPTLDAPPNLVVAKNAGVQTVNLSGITTGAANETATLKITATSSAPAVIPNPQVTYTSPNATGTLNFTPVAGATGLVTIQVKLEEVENPGVQVTRSFTVKVADHLPSFLSGPNVQAQEDAAFSAPAWATSITTDPNGPQGPVSFELTTNNDTLFSAAPAISPAGELSFTGAPDAFGQATATVRLHVGDQVGDPETFTITVTPVDDPPSFTAGPSLSVTQRSGTTVLPNWATQIKSGPANETEAVHFVVGVDHPEYFALQPSLSATGTLSFAPRGDATGTAIITVYAQDAGGAQSAPISRNIQITASTFTAGNYRALVQAPAGRPTGNGGAGWVNLTLTPNGQFTGRIVLAENQVRPLEGKISATGAALFGRKATAHLVLAIKNLPPLDLQLSLGDSADGPELTGILSSLDAPFAQVSGGLAAYTAAKNPTAPFRNVPDPLLGRYTIALTPQAAAQGNPTGSGYATLTVSRNGTATLTGRTPDDRTITWSGPILDDLSLPIYIPILAGRGSLSGFAHFRDVPNVSDLDGQDLHWSSPRTPKGPAFDAVQVILTGAQYTGAGFVGLQPADHVDYHVHLTLPSPVEQDIQITNGVSPSMLGTGLKLSINAQTGLLTGSYQLPGTAKPLPFRGAILSKQSTAYGYFTGASHGEAVVITPR